MPQTGPQDAAVGKARPVFHRELGKSFEQRRMARGWSQNQAVLRAKQLGVPISLSSLRYLEEGKTKHPDAEALRSLARLYELDYQELVAAFVGRTYSVAVQRVSNALTLETDTEPAQFASVKLIHDPIAAGPPLEINESDIDGYMAFAQRALDKQGIDKPVCVRVGRRERSMSPTINPHDVVLLDCSDERRLTPKPDRIYAVNIAGEGATLKRLLAVPSGIALISDNPDKDDYPTRTIILEEGQSLIEIVIGEVMWWGEPL